MGEGIAVGQTWRRKSDGQETMILGVPVPYAQRWVVHKGLRLTRTELPNFLRKYELAKEASDADDN